MHSETNQPIKAQTEEILNPDSIQESHFMYVLMCADDTLYTGYTNDVEARVATHNAGKGAKYTRNRGPVELLAQARFDSKTEAMSAEYHFKKLSRSSKESLIEQAGEKPFEEVLRQNLKLKTPKDETEDSSKSTTSEDTTNDEINS